jgi:hypothetical protein
MAITSERSMSCSCLRWKTLPLQQEQSGPSLAMKIPEGPRRPLPPRSLPSTSLQSSSLENLRRVKPCSAWSVRPIRSSVCLSARWQSSRDMDSALFFIYVIVWALTAKTNPPCPPFAKGGTF